MFRIASKENLTATAVCLIGTLACGGIEETGKIITNETNRSDVGKQQESVDVFFTQTVDDVAIARLSETKGQIETQLLRDINFAKQTIDAALYSLNRQNVITALCASEATVRIVTECENYEGKYSKWFRQLEECGVRVSNDGSSFRGEYSKCPGKGGTMHDKFFVIDRDLVWMGSANITDTGLNYNENHAVRIKSKTIGDWYTDEFDEMWSGRYGKNKRGRGDHVHSINGVRLSLRFSPYITGGRSQSRQLVTDAIFSAGSQLYFAAFYFTDAEVRSALLSRATIAKGIIDASGASYEGSQHRSLCSAKVPVVVENAPGKVHHKLGVFDSGTESDPQVVLGSANWTKSGFEYNDENLLKLEDREIANLCHREIQRLVYDHRNEGLVCCDHSAEGFNNNSPMCGDVPCVCDDGQDNDYDGRIDGTDEGCLMRFVCK